MKILTDWLYTVEGLRCRVVEQTDAERARAIPLMDFLRESKQDSFGNNDLCEGKPDK
jgi:hypothetical protein